MPLHFQVYADFTLTSNKPSLVSLSISSTFAACTSRPFFPYEKTYLTISRIFPTFREAQSYIAYLKGVYPQSPATPPALVGGQIELFPEVSE